MSITRLTRTCTLDLSTFAEQRERGRGDPREYLMRGIPRVSRLALYYAGNAPLPATTIAVRDSTRRSLFGSFKREKGAPCTWPCALADSGRLSSTSASSSTKTTTTGSSSLLSSTSFYAALSSSSRSRPFPLSRSCRRVLLQFWVRRKIY